MRNEDRSTLPCSPLRASGLIFRLLISVFLANFEIQAGIQASVVYHSFDTFLAMYLSLFTSFLLLAAAQTAPIEILTLNRDFSLPSYSSLSSAFEPLVNPKITLATSDAVIDSSDWANGIGTSGFLANDESFGTSGSTNFFLSSNQGSCVEEAQYDTRSLEAPMTADCSHGCEICSPDEGCVHADLCPRTVNHRIVGYLLCPPNKLLCYQVDVDKTSRMKSAIVQLQNGN